MAEEYLCKNSDDLSKSKTQLCSKCSCNLDIPNSGETHSDGSAKVTVEQAVQGLLKAIMFFDANPSLAQNYTEMLWNIIKHIQASFRSVDGLQAVQSVRVNKTSNRELESQDTTLEMKVEVDIVPDNLVMDEELKHTDGIPGKEESGEYDSDNLSDPDYEPNGRRQPQECDDLAEDGAKVGVSEKHLENSEVGVEIGGGLKVESGLDELGEMMEFENVDSYEGNKKGVSRNSVTLEEEDNSFQNQAISDITCSDCNQSFENVEFLQKHQYSSHNNGCKELRPRTTRSARKATQRLKNSHRKNKNSTDTLKNRCNICDKLLSSQSALKCHLRTHACRKEFKCDICSISFKHSCTLKNHLKKHLDLKCDTCGDVFHARSDLRKHMKTHIASKKTFSCALCDRSYKNEICLQKHLKVVHTVEDKHQTDCVCTVCEEHFPSSMDLHHHRRKEKHYQCVKCNEGCNSMESLISHMNSHDEKTFYCKICERTFMNARSFVIHMKLHTGEELHQCSECGKSFLLRDSLKTHMREHMSARDHECTICGSKFFLEKELKSHHRRIHLGEKRHMCPTCGKRFYSSGQLGQHAKVHTGEKRYACPLCDKRYSSSGGLQVHVRTHTGERPSQCSVCDKSFIHSSDLKRHMAVHTGDKAHQCTECGKRFSQACNLRTHMRTHTGQKPYKCPVCFNAFGHAVSLRGHMKQHQNDALQRY